ncbi:MAG: Asp-tRNA(Asn)/Glu-tRNA(Gln) amidotransferase subunit GatC [Acidobacteriaceae bacterium]|nr:Asp-tRNA(Asn)/Glu-tRNA(Gln) amidotransferase subunit GatC [Acidobacteriaceae bacterium]MBV9779693.1 Asp-tRNA(Asn)/Glu-tRNA(Gln) amidotransferase subunit GatC [Acidobacteriaceae bacterium]
MKLSDEKVRYVADLANLRLTEEEVYRMSHDLGQVLTHMEQLNQLDTTSIEPMAQVLFEEDEIATLREDIPRATLSNDEALHNAAASGKGYFKVPRVIER